MSERRNEHRCAVNWPMRAGHPSVGCAFGTTLNIAGSSAAFALAEKYALDDRVEVEIAAGPKTLIRCTARILRAEPLSDTHFRYAARLEQFAGLDRQILASLVRGIEEARPHQPFSRIMVARSNRAAIV